MASIQQLEKLYQIEKIFHVENSLEAAVAGERIRSVINRTEQTMRQRAFLREERRRLRVSTEKLEERKKALTLIERADWLPVHLTDADQRMIRINVGGLMFETSETVLQRDPESLLSKLASSNPPLMPEADGSFVFNRDWWLFRFILAFLRDGVLPDDRGVLAQLYKETSYWHLSEMQHAIEEQKLHLKKTNAKKDDNEAAAEDKKKWWRQQPSWWRAVNDAEASAAEADKAKKGKGKDWWTSDQYNGKSFAPPAADKKAKTARKPTEGTWGTELSGDNGAMGYNASGGYGSSALAEPSALRLPDPYGFLKA